MFKRVILLVATCVCFGLASYFTYFHRPPTDDILAANLALNQHQLQAAYSEETSELAVASRKQWDAWIAVNNFVSIGHVFDKCEWENGSISSAVDSGRTGCMPPPAKKCTARGPNYQTDCSDGKDRITVGRVILLPDHINGGVISKAYVNVTFDQDLSTGQMHLECQYKHTSLYSNQWDMCTVEDDMDDRVIFCPIRAGRRKFIKQIKIPNYLPKGLYTTKAWLTDSSGRTIICGLSEFTI